VAHRIKQAETFKVKTKAPPSVYLLSGLLECKCGRNFTMCSASMYACSAFHGGKACTVNNNYRVNREKLEKTVIGHIREKLLDPKRVARMSEEMRAEFEARLRDQTERTEALPQVVQELDSRIARLRERLKTGDTDLAADELQVAIARAMEKREEAVAALRPAAAKADHASILAALPDAAKRHREMIDKGLSESPEETARARMVRRDLLGGSILLEPTKAGLFAHIGVARSVLVKEAAKPKVGSRGSGGCFELYSKYPLEIHAVAANVAASP
jgi:site-specific DNA recombinase